MQTSNLSLPLIAANQAQKHVTHNEALVMLDDLIMASVISASLDTPPTSPLAGDRYIVRGPGAGVWSGKADQLAVWRDGGWTFHAPKKGWRLNVEESGEQLSFSATGWSSLTRVGRLGINAAPAGTNALTVEGSDTLLSGGGGGHQLRINKGSVSATASFVLQTAFSGRAEIGLAGSDRLSVKTSADGTVWRECLSFDPSNGAVSLPQNPGALTGQNILINGDFSINQRAFTGGSLALGNYGFDRWKATGSNTSLIVSGAGLVTLASGEISQVLEPAAWGYESFSGMALTASVEAPSAAIRVRIAGIEATLAAGSGRHSATIVVPAAVTGTVTVSLSRLTTGSVTFQRAKVEAGTAPTAWNARPASLEELLAERYFYRITGPVSLFLYAQAAGNYMFNNVPLPVGMRALPNVTRILGTYANLFQNEVGNATAAPLNSGFLRISVRSNAAGLCYANFDRIDCDAEL
jgi:hypothetical protein